MYGTNNQNRGYQLPNLQGDPLSDDVQGNVRQRTHLIQLYTQDPDEGPRLISDYHPQGVPIMVIVDPPSSCYFKLNIPHGIVSLEQKWGKYTGQMTPGYHMCYCSHKRIAAMISKNSIQFNTPIEACPTKDNVIVSVDIGITFHIGKDGSRERDCEQFLYYLGANKLEELLEQESEEKIRIFVRTIKVNQIRDIKSELTSKLMAELNSRFNSFGVYVEQVNVMNVIIPKDLRIALQQATTYDVFLQNQVKFQENLRIKMMNQENMKVQTLIRENQKKMLELNNQLIMEEINLQKFKVNTETEQQVRIITANEHQQIKLIQAQASKNLAEQRAKKQAESILAEAKAYSESKITRILARKQNLQQSAQTRYNTAKLKFEGLIKEADAETEQANNLDLKRKHEQRMMKTNNMQMMMKDKNIIIAGKNGEDLLEYFNQTSQMVDEQQLQRQQSVDSNKDNKKHNLKQSLEQQHKLNKQKFQDPFFIQIGGGNGVDASGDAQTNLKIVKQRRKDDNDNTIDHNESDANDDNNKHRLRMGSTTSANNNLPRNSIAQLKNKQQSNQTVFEAREEEESSPKLPRGGNKSPTRNNNDESRGLNKNKILHDRHHSLLSDIDKFEKISDDGQSTTGVKTLPQLVRLDVNLDTLKNFLEDIQEAINDHAKTINVIQGEMKKKANEGTVSHYFMKISEGLHKECGERPHAFRLNNEQHNYLSDNYQSDDSVQLKRMAEKLQEKLEIIGLNIIQNNRFKNQADERLEKLERIIPKCFTIDQFREESQIQESRTMNYIDDRLGLFQENLNNYKKELNEALTHFDKKVNDNQSETLWRIKDCEELLKSRVSDKYVNDATKAVEEKVTKQLNFMEEKSLERLEKSFKELGTRIVTTNQFFQEKFDDLRKIMASYDSKITNMATNEKLASVQTGYRDMKYNFEREMEMLQEHVKETKDKIGELNKRFSNLEIATTSYANGGDFNYQMPGQPNHANMQQTSRNSQFYNQQSVNKDPNQKSSTSIKKSPSSKDQLNKHDSSQHSQHQQQVIGNSPGSQNFSPIAKKRMNRAADAAYAAEMEKRLIMFEQQFEHVDGKIESLKKQLDDKITKEDVRKLTSDKISKEDLEHIIPNEEISQEKFRYLVKEEIEMFSIKMNEQFKQFDNKMIRLRAEVDIHSIQRQLERKANEEQVRSDFGNHEFKIGTLDRNIIRMATDFETFQLALNKIHSAIVELQDANRDVLLGKKATNCLSCGKGGDVVQTVKGKDGRLYKAETTVGNVKLHQDDSALLPTAHYQLYDTHSPLTGTMPQNMNGNLNHQVSINQYNQQDNNDFFKMRQSNSFYDSAPGGGYDQNNLPQLHNKKSSFGGQNKHTLIKGMASHAGLNTSAMLNGQSSTSLNPAGNNSYHQPAKKKLPFGFQVQQEKKELFKIGINQQRGKSSQNNRKAQSNRGYEMLGAITGRPDSAKNKVDNSYNFNSTYDQN